MTWNDRDDFEQNRADVELLEPLDVLHAASVENRILIRREFAAARRRVAAWEPAPYPSRYLRWRSRRPAAVAPVYLDEVDRFRPWLRS